MGRHLIHRPVIDPHPPIRAGGALPGPELLDGALSGEESLARCFQLARERRFALMRPAGEDRQALAGMLSRLEEALGEKDEFGGELLARTCLFQLLIRLNRMALRDTTSQREGVSQYDPKISQILDYINGNLTADLSVDAPGRPVLYQQIPLYAPLPDTDRLLSSPVCQREAAAGGGRAPARGASAQEAGLRCGFQDYSAFQRAFKRQFGLTPRQLRSGTAQLSGADRGRPPSPSVYPPAPPRKRLCPAVSPPPAWGRTRSSGSCPGATRPRCG